MQILQRKPPLRLDPCPADERVCEYYDVPHAYQPGVKGGKETQVVTEDGVMRQKCGGGYRVLKKKIGGD